MCTTSTGSPLSSATTSVSHGVRHGESQAAEVSPLTEQMQASHVEWLAARRSSSAARKLGSSRRARLELFPLPGSAPLLAEVDLSFVLKPGDNSVGDVVMRGLPLLASGVCMGPNGPVEGVQVRLVAKRMTKVGAEWSPVGSLMASSNLQGEFELWGELEGDGPFGVSGRRRGFQLAILDDVAPPITGVTLQMEPGEEDLSSMRSGKTSRPREAPFSSAIST